MPRSGRKYTCNDHNCTKSYSPPEKHSKHKNAVRGGDVIREECIVIACGDTFQSKFCKNRHGRNKHLGMKNTECDECGAKFSTKYQVEGHKITDVP